jgi:branched-chain amino acid transport system permease protein
MAHQALFGIGAYASTLVVIHAHWSPFGGMLVAIVVAAGIGLAIGAVSFRAVGAYFAIATFGFGGIIALVINRWESVTGGTFGLSSPPLSIPIGGHDYVLYAPRSLYYVAVIALLITLVVIRLFLRSRIGRSAIAVREHPDLAAAVGINVYRTRVLTFAVSAGIAGLAGALYAHYIGFISSETAGIYYLVAFLIMVVFGGSGTLLGPIVGAMVFTLVPEVLRIQDQTRLLMFSAVLLVTVMLFPKGFVPGISAVIARLRLRTLATAAVLALLLAEPLTIG